MSYLTVDIDKINKVLQQEKYRDLGINPTHIQIICNQSQVFIIKRVIKYFLNNGKDVVHTIMDITDRQSDMEYDDDDGDEIDWSKLRLPPIIV